MLLKFLTFKEIYFFPGKIRRENYVPKKLKEKNAKKLSKSSSYVSIVSWCQMNPPPYCSCFFICISRMYFYLLLLFYISKICQKYSKVTKRFIYHRIFVQCQTRRPPRPVWWWVLTADGLFER